MKLTLTDTASGEASGITFSGTLNGTLTGTTSALTSTFDNPVTQERTLGGHVYAVTISPTLANLPSPIDTAPALLDASVQISTLNDPGPGPNPGPEPGPSNAPEPCSLLLCATAAAGLAARWWAARAAG